MIRARFRLTLGITCFCDTAEVRQLISINSGIAKCEDFLELSALRKTFRKSGSGCDWSLLEERAEHVWAHFPCTQACNILVPVQVPACTCPLLWSNQLPLQPLYAKVFLESDTRGAILPVFPEQHILVVHARPLSSLRMRAMPVWTRSL